MDCFCAIHLGLEERLTYYLAFQHLTAYCIGINIAFLNLAAIIGIYHGIEQDFYESCRFLFPDSLEINHQIIKIHQAFQVSNWTLIVGSILRRYNIN